MIVENNCMSCGSEFTNEDYVDIHVGMVEPYIGGKERRVMSLCKKCSNKLLAMITIYMKPVQEFFKMMLSGDITCKCPKCGSDTIQDTESTPDGKKIITVLTCKGTCKRTYKFDHEHVLLEDITNVTKLMKVSRE